jgi:acetyltransferase
MLRREIGDGFAMPMMFRAMPGRFHPEALFRPGSVAVIGAGGGLGGQVMANLLSGGFRGAILPVGVGLGAVGGVLAYDDIAALPLVPDLAIICTPPSEVDRTIRVLAARGTRAGIVVSGSGEPPGPLRTLGSETGLRCLGPNSFGLAVPALGLNATRSHLTPRPGRVALVSQSAALCRAVLDWAEPNGVGFSHVVGIGTNDDLGFGLVLDWLSRDAGTGAILLDIRRIKDARLFLSVARAAARLRPVVALRAGFRLLDASGAAEATFIAALRRCGVLCVETLEDLLAAAETLTRSRPARIESLAIVTNAVGPAQLAADAALRDGLRLAALAPETREVVRLRLPDAFGGDPTASLGDIVYTGTDHPAALGEAAALLAGAREVGGVIAIHAPTGAADATAMEAMAAAAKAAKVPLLVCVMGETTGAAHRQRLAGAGVPVFATPGQAVRGFLHLVQDRRNRAAASELPPSTVLTVAPDRDAVRRLFGQAHAAGRLVLAQADALAVLAAYGVPIVPFRAAAGADDAVAAAALLGFPAVLKRIRLDRPEPGTRSGVALDLRDAEAVRDAAALLERRASPPNEAPGFLVQRQVGRARELRIQAGEDDLFGPTIIFGQGGTAADALGDAAVDLPPLNLRLAHGLIGRTRVAATLGALHDQPAANVHAVAETLVRVSQLLVDFPDIAELDINPLFADASGVLAADAWVRLRPSGERVRLAIPPYPAELTWTYRSRGADVTIRPIRPEDAKAHAAFFDRLTPQDIRFRFFSAMRELSAEQIARLTQVDYEREMAFVATRPAADDGPAETVGVARVVRETGSDEGEFAIAVAPDAKGTGVGRELMRHLIDWARAQGMRTLVGLVLADNAPMLAFVRKLGFSVQRVPSEPDVVEARLALRPEDAAAT